MARPATGFVSLCATWLGFAGTSLGYAGTSPATTPVKLQRH
jgi:hypothetical protein